jgi:outer membrane protein OmpA-like peptidoglycan-associated protein
MKSTFVATSLAVALLTWPLAGANAQQNEIVVAQAEDAEALAKYNEIVADTRPVADLTDKELNQRQSQIRPLLNNQSLSKPQIQKLRQIARDGREELLKRRQAKADERKKAQAEAKAAKDAEQQAAAASQPASEVQQTAQNTSPAVEAEAKAQKFLADTADVSKLSASDLRTRMREARTLMADKNVPQSLQPKLRARQGELREAMQKQAAAANQQDSGSGEAQPAPTAAEMDAKVQKYLDDTADLGKLSERDLRGKFREGRSLIQSKNVPSAQVPKIRERQAAIMKAMQDLQQAGKNDQNGGTGNNQQQTTTEESRDPASSTEAAKKLLADNRAPTSLSEDELQTRLKTTRDLLAARDLPPTTVKQLRLNLARDRTEFRRRKAADQAGNDRNDNQQSGSNNRPNTELRSDDYYLSDSRRAATLDSRELERRVLVRRIAVVDTRYPIRDRNRWREEIEIDRAELRRRALVDRERRRDEWRDRRDRGDLDIDLNIVIDLGGAPPYRPRPIYMAEAEDELIQDYLVAAPTVRPSRRYTMQEVRTMPEVRQTMPAVEVDTIKFGFNEDFVREEALEDLDRVGEVIEKILAAHPGEVFLLEGHTDAVGSDNYNLDLSRRRAEAVKQALVTYYNIDARNIETAGYGEQFLRIQTPDAEEENRRVTIRRATPLVGELR